MKWEKGSDEEDLDDEEDAKKKAKNDEKKKKNQKPSSDSDEEDEEDESADEDDEAAPAPAALISQAELEEEETAQLVRRRVEHETAVLYDKLHFLQNQLLQAQEHAARAWLRSAVADAAISALSGTLVHLDYVVADVVRHESGISKKKQELEQEERALALEIATLKEIERRSVGSRRRENRHDPLITATRALARASQFKQDKRREDSDDIENALRVTRIANERQIAELQAKHRAEIAAIQARSKIAFRAQHAEARAKAVTSTSADMAYSIYEATTVVTRRVAEQIEHQRTLRSALFAKSKHLADENESLIETNEALKDLMEEMTDEYGRALEATELLRSQLHDVQLRLEEDRRERMELLEAKKRKLNLSTEYVVQQKDKEIVAARRLLKDLQDSVESVARAYGHSSPTYNIPAMPSPPSFSPIRRL